MEEQNKKKEEIPPYTNTHNDFLILLESPNSKLNILQIKIILYVYYRTTMCFDEKTKSRKKTVILANSFLAKRYGVSERYIKNLLKDLVKRNVLINCKKDTKRNVWKINTKYLMWKIFDEPNQEDHDEKPNPDTKKNLEDHDRQFDMTCYSNHNDKNLSYELQNEIRQQK